VNHSTFLIQMDGVNILTDPIWSDRASPVSFSGPRRFHPPGITFDDLPRIDLVLVTHNHYDHLDIPTLKKIALRDNPAVVTTLGNRALLRTQGFTQVAELDWWQQMPVSDAVRITCVPAQHFSGRGLFDSYETLWAGFVLESAAGAVFFAGDTGLGPHFKQIAERFKKIRLALLPIGAFKPEWFMSFGHLSPAAAVQAHFILNAQTSVAMHFGTFPLADDNQDDPVTMLHAALAGADMNGTGFWVLGFGQGRDVPPVHNRDYAPARENVSE
jgi:L-ascorbate metabolism protein UlaG (beta-lactamase superfamily)